MKKKNLIDQPLTDMQKKFANLYVQESGLLSKTEIAVKAGYDKESAYQRAYELTNPSISPHVVRYIKKIEMDFAEKNQITKENHIAELWRLKQEAREKGMAGIALRAEELRGKLMGYYIDKSMTLNVKEKTVDELEQEIKDKLKLWKPVLNDNKKK